MEDFIAKGIDKTYRFIHKKRMERWISPEGFDVDGHTRRFGALASVVSGRDLEVAEIRGDTPPRDYYKVLVKMAHPALRPEHAFGWCDGETVFLPTSLIDMEDAEGQERLARLLLFFLALQAGEGALDTAREKRTLLEGDRLVSDFFWIIENTRLLGVMRREFPGVARSWEGIARRMLERRPSERYLSGAGARVEDFLRETVEATFSGGGAATASAEESLERARALAEKWASEGFKVGRYRSMVPFVPWGKLIAGRVKEPEPEEETREVKDSDRSGPGEGEGEDDGNGSKNRYASKRRDDIDEEANQQGLTLNIYDKLMSWAEFVNVPRPFDDDPEEDLEKKADELDELTTAEVEKSTSSTFDAELEKFDRTEDVTEVELPDEGVVYTYPEWDYRRKGYREARSVLREVEAPPEDAGFVSRVLAEKRGVIKEVTRKLETLTPETRLMGRQFEGELIDIDAVVEAAADLEAGRTPSEKLYATYDRTERDLSVLFLVDLSMSTDAWVGDRKIIDHEKESLIILCEAMRKLQDRYAVYGFSGKSRKGCRFYHVKSFDEAYGPRVRDRIGGLIPYSYTRMGPAVRHATEKLKDEPARARLLFILSDGKPNDVDVYEGRYGIEDTRMAVKEAEREGIVPFCLTVDTAARDYLPRVFGPGNHAVVPSVDRLAKKLPELYARIVRAL